MSETKRIRWHTDDDGETTGYVGSLDRPVFRIWPPDDDGDCLLFLYLAGHAGDLYHGATIDGQQAEAERLLEEFVSSLGAVFPDMLREIVTTERVRRDEAAGVAPNYELQNRYWGWTDALDWVLTLIGSEAGRMARAERADYDNQEG